MAVAGSATTAYRLRMTDGKVSIEHTTAIKDACTEVYDALDMLQAGRTVTIAGNDMWTMQQVMAANGIERA